MRGLCLVFLIINIFIGYSYAQNNKKHPFEVYDNVRNHAAKRIVNMSYELVIEAKLLQRRIQPIQTYYMGQISYEVGYVMGKIRERYKRMIEIYKQAHYMTKHLYLNSTTNQSELNTTFALKPGIKMYYPINWVINMEYMRLFETDIDKLIEVLENIPSYALGEVNKSNPIIQSSSKPQASPKPSPEGSTSLLLPASPLTPKTPEKVPDPRLRPPGTLRSGPPSILNEPPPSVPNVAPPRVPNEAPTSVPNEPPPIVPNEAPPSVPNEAPPIVPNVAPPIVPNEAPPIVPNEAPPIVPNEAPLSVRNESPPGPPSQSYEAPQTQSHDSPPSFPDEALPDPVRQSYEASQSQSYDSAPSFPNEALPDPVRQSYEASQSQSHDSPPSFPDEALPDPVRQSYEASQSQSYDSAPSFPNEALPDPVRQSYEAPQSQSHASPLNQPTEPSAASNAKVIRFGSADTNFRTEEELKEYYRAMYRANHEGINDKYDNLYR